jgi:predicted dinucleotide-binding enzyme
LELNPPMEISETSQSTLIIEIFVPVWFMGKDGMVMDPNEQSNAEKINENIEESFEAVEEAFED